MSVSHAESLVRNVGLPAGRPELSAAGKRDRKDQDSSRLIPALITFLVGFVGAAGFAVYETDDLLRAIYSPQFDLWEELILKDQGLQGALGAILVLWGFKISIFNKGSGGGGVCK